MQKRIVSALCAMLMVAGGVSQTYAAPVTYNLTYSNNAAGHISGDPLLVTDDIPNDGTIYATVTIDDMVTPGLINFTVALSSYWNDKIDSGFGIQSFGFNLLDTGGATGLTAGDVIIPGSYVNWSTTVGSTNQDGLGAFDVVLSAQGGQGGPDRQNPLEFSIDLGGDSISDYVAESIAGANGSFLFAVHIAGFTDQNPDDPLAGCTTLDANNPDCNYLTSVWVANSAVVPVPAAVWLFGSGLIGLVGLARRKKA